MTEILRNHGAPVIDKLRNKLEDCMDFGDKIGLLRLIQDEHHADVAEALDLLQAEEVAQIFKAIMMTDVALCSEILIELDQGTVSHLYPYLSNQEWAVIFTELSDDDVVWLLELFPDEARQPLMARLTSEDKEDVLELMTFPEDSAGRIMTNEFLSMDVRETVATAVEKIRGTRDFDPMNLFFVYVTESERLVGMVSLRQLLLSKKTDNLQQIMRTDVTALDAWMDQEEVAEIVRKHDEVTMPVVDKKGHILGIITVDDIIDVIDEESEEDILKMVGTSEEEMVAGGRTRKIVALRLPWLFAACCGSLMVALIMKYSDHGLFGNKAADIFVFVPMVCAMGGNVGVQSSTIMARYLSTTNPDWRETRRSTLKEARVGLTLGLICGTLVGLVATQMGGMGLAFTVLAAMTSAMTTAATTGTIIPVVMKRMGIDPALATGPFVTSFNDVVATLVYFAIAYTLLDYVHVT
ncbi:MAG: magnesium transporter [Acidobacteriota bacterium]|nr:magnesium transporter [Acidobacteriota bacterium]